MPPCGPRLVREAFPSVPGGAIVRRVEPRNSSSTLRPTGKKSRAAGSRVGAHPSWQLAQLQGPQDRPSQTAPRSTIPQRQSPSRRAILDETQAYGRDAGLTLRMLFTGACSGCSTSSSPSSCSSFLNVGLDPDARDRRRDGRSSSTSPPTSSRCGPPARRSSSARRRRSCTTWSSGSARWPTCRSRGSRSSTRDVPNAFATGPQPEARGRRRHDRPLEPARAARDRGRARARALAHREPRRPDHDRRQLLRDARRRCSPASGSTAACSAAAAATATTTACRSG